MANRIVKIKDICHVVKGGIGITKAIPGNYPMVTLAEERKTHNEFQFDCKAVIIPLVSSTGHGHASMKRIHFQEGKFALGSILCALVPKNENEYVPEYLFHILDMGKERIFVPLMKGMANVSLPMNRIKDVEINLPPYEEQLELAEIYQEVSTNISLLKTATEKQVSFIPKIRRSILKLALQGKITSHWRKENIDYEPASILLENVKKEKEQLIINGHLKRQKSLPPIEEENIPYLLPKNWVWSILDEISLFKNGKAHEQFIDDTGEYILINSRFVSTNGKVVKKTNSQMMPMFINEIALVMSDVPNGKALSRCFFIDADEKYSLNQRIGGISAVNGIYPKYLLLALDRNSYYLSFDDGKKQTNLKRDQILTCPIPLPPFEEQKEIVSKVEQLMSWCDELEKKIEKRDAYQDKMMQAVVKQAFKTEDN